MSRTAAVILAGGGARRMGGGDKPLLELAGEPIIRRILAALDTPEVAISANGDPARFSGLNLPVLPDRDFADQGPLAGVLAGLDWAAGLGAATLLTVPGDTPFIPHGLAAALAPAPSCAASQGHAHHLVALWPVACRDELRHLLSVPGRRDVMHFARAIGMRRVDFAVAKWDPFLNVNTPHELAVARAIAEGQT
ncbi:MAG: molybdenum cofactor guanylyltransferase MobA [Acetobacteraceae bacterium]